jgi:hypothetical protein
MDGRRSAAAVAMLAACAAVVGCGGDDKKDTGSDAAKAARTLKRPILAPCAAPEFAKPRITRPQNNVWSLQYTRVKRPPRRQRGASRTILLVEHPPGVPPSAEFGRGAKQVRIAGRRVAFNQRSAKSPFYSVQWKTKRALYTMIADGRHPAAVRRFIGCLP